MTSIMQSHGINVPQFDTGDLQTVKNLSMDFLSPVTPPSQPVSPPCPPCPVTMSPTSMNNLTLNGTQTSYITNVRSFFFILVFFI